MMPWFSGWSRSIGCQGWWRGRNYFRCCLSLPNPQACCWCLFSGQLYEVLKTCPVLINYELEMETVLIWWNGLGNPRALGHPLEYARVFQAFVWCMLFQKVACPWFILLDRKVATVLRYSRLMRVLTASFIRMISHQYQVKYLEISIVLLG